jgi:hypothetical protein
VITKNSLFALSALTALVASPLAHAGLYAASKSTEATYSFKAQVEASSRSTPDDARAREAIEAQVQHLFGPWSLADVKAVPKQDHTIAVESIERTGPGRYLISYSFEGTIALENIKGVNDGETGTYAAYLPVNPSKVFASAMRGERNPCTDDHYQSEGDFWYFWAPSPMRPGCRLLEGTDYVVVQGSYKRIPNTRVTYPEYHRMADPVTGAIEATLFFGLNEPEDNSKDPDQSQDINAENYLKVREELRDLGFSVERLDDAAKSKLVRKEDARAESFTVERLSKDTPRGPIHVLMYFGATGIDEESHAFHALYKLALEKNTFMLYNGHSGLGGHLDLASISEVSGISIHLPRDRYQVFFFNSCTSYTYYNLDYLKRKRTSQDPEGTKNLDIFANGLSTAFYVMQDSDMVLLRAIDLWATQGIWTSYQDMAKAIDSDNLFGVNGDQDNPVRPVKE